MENLTGLNEVFEIIAKELGVGIELVKANGMEYILEYGKYSIVGEVIMSVIIAILLFIVLMGATIIIGLLIRDEVSYGNEDKYFRIVLISGGIIAFVLSSIYVLHDIIVYNISPLMYSLDAISKLLE